MNILSLHANCLIRAKVFVISFCHVFSIIKHLVAFWALSKSGCICTNPLSLTGIVFLLMLGDLLQSHQYCQPFVYIISILFLTFISQMVNEAVQFSMSSVTICISFVKCTVKMLSYISIGTLGILFYNWKLFLYILGNCQCQVQRNHGYFPTVHNFKEKYSTMKSNL